MCRGVCPPVLSSSGRARAWSTSLVVRIMEPGSAAYKEASAKVLRVLGSAEKETMGLAQAADALDDLFRQMGLLYEQPIPPRNVPAIRLTTLARVTIFFLWEIPVEQRECKE